MEGRIWRHERTRRKTRSNRPRLRRGAGWEPSDRARLQGCIARVETFRSVARTGIRFGSGMDDMVTGQSEPPRSRGHKNGLLRRRCPMVVVAPSVASWAVDILREISPLSNFHQLRDMTLRRSSDRRYCRVRRRATLRAQVLSLPPFMAMRFSVRLPDRAVIALDALLVDRLMPGSARVSPNIHSGRHSPCLYVSGVTQFGTSGITRHRCASHERCATLPSGWSPTPTPGTSA